MYYVLCDCESVEESSIKLNYDLKYSEDALDLASYHEHVNVLGWWKESGLELKYSMYVLDFASEYGHVNVVDWWLK